MAGANLATVRVDRVSFATAPRPDNFTPRGGFGGAAECRYEEESCSSTANCCDGATCVRTGGSGMCIVLGGVQ